MPSSKKKKPTISKEFWLSWENERLRGRQNNIMDKIEDIKQSVSILPDVLMKDLLSKIAISSNKYKFHELLIDMDRGMLINTNNQETYIIYETIPYYFLKLLIQTKSICTYGSFMKYFEETGCSRKITLNKEVQDIKSDICRNLRRRGICEDTVNKFIYTKNGYYINPDIFGKSPE